MRYRRIKLCVVFLFGLEIAGVHAQEIVVTAGGDASGSSGSVSYSIGQVAYTCNSNENGIVTQGVQQPFEISVVNGIADDNTVDLLVSVYPNPATDFLILKVDKVELSKLTVCLFDMNGILLDNKPIESTETRIGMGNRLPAIYFLKVIEGSKEIKIFKIIKN